MDPISSSPLSSVAADVSETSLPSSPLSHFSRTPSLPGSPDLRADLSDRYPSPSATSMSGTQSPVKLGEPLEDDSPRPAKKRRITPPRERTTTYVDLMKPNEDLSHEDNFHVERLLSALRKKKKIVVVAGAGISVSAGIPDFRSATGLFATARSTHKLKASGKHLFDASVYKHDETTSSFHTMVREMAEMSKRAQPTPFHHLLASLAQEGRLLRLYSQNIDCLDTDMKPLQTQIPLEPKAPWPTTVQLHGSLEKMVCTKCGDISPFRGDIFDGPEAPLCEVCKNLDIVRTAHAGKRSHGIGRLRPRFVLYNEYNPDEEAIGRIMKADLRARPDAVLVVGTTLKVPGTRRLVKEMCQVTRGRKDGLTAWVNIDPEPKVPEFKDCWDLVVRSKCDSIARLTALPPWDTEIGDDYLVSKDQDAERLASPPVKMEVQLDGKARDVHAIPTPRSSPPPTSATKAQPKAKQTKLSFGVKKIPDEDGDKKPQRKPTKPRARKPKQAGKAKPPPAGGVSDSFKTSKNMATVPAAKKLEPGLPGARTPLKDGRNLSIQTGLAEPARGAAADAPTTPTMQGSPRETISPKSVPNNMRNLIDVA